MLLLKLSHCLKYCLFIALVILFTSGNLSAQVTLGSSPYTENFNGIGGGLPTGWSVYIGTTPTALGSPGTYVNTPGTATAWAQTTGNFRNCASATGSASGDATTAQTGRADRALGIRTSAAFGEGQHCFALHLTNTTGRYGFQISFKAMLLNVQPKINNYQIDYGFGASPTVFTQASAPATFTDLGINGGAWGTSNITVNFGNALDNNGGDVWIRIANLVTTGSGNHCTMGIDDVNLTWSTVPAAVSLSSPNPSVPATSVTAGTINNLLYRADVTVANCASSLTALNITTAGSYAAADLLNLKLWFQAGTPFNSATATLITTKTTGLGAGVQSFTGINQAYTIGTGYLFVTADLACSASATNTINIATPVAANFTFGATVPTGTLFAGAAQTIIGLAPSNVTAVGCTPGNGELDIAWTNPPCYDEIMIIATDNPGGVTSVPAGNGSLYTQNADYNDGTNFANLNPNEFCIYKGAASPVTMTNLVNGVTYFTKVFTRIGSTWSSGATCSTMPVPAVTGDFRSIGNGNWTNYLTWEKFTTAWVPALAGEYPNSQTSSVTIQAGNTVTLDDDGISVKTLTVAATAKLFCNTYAVNRYLSVFGSIACNGIIGNAPVQDYICFNIEAATCNITGTGTFNCNRIRKNTGVNATTNLNINSNITTWWTGTAIYNAYNGAASTFNVTIVAGKTVNCSNGGNYAIDGQTGTTPGTSAGTTTVNGTLTVSNTLYLTCFNPATFNCTVAVGGTGIINAATVSMAATSGGAQHFFTIATGGKLNITGTLGISPFSTTSNNYTLSAGSAVEYSAAGAEPVEAGLSYSNLTISGSGTKNSNGNVSVGNIFLLTSGTYSQNTAVPYYTTTIAAGGTLTGNGGNFVTGDTGGTLSFAGNGTINGTTALGFNILKVNAGTVTNTITNATCDTLNLTGGIFVIGSGLTFNMLPNAVVNATAGNFATGATGGILNFQAAGKFIGNSSPYDVYTSGGVDFGGGTVTIQGGGSFRINSGGYANTNGCFYAINSTLVYNNGSSFNAGAEWYALASSGRGVPYNVQIGTSAVSNTGVTFNTSNAWRQMNGNLFIGPASGGTGYGLILSTVFGGDILVGGNWTRAPAATFTHNTRAVTFNGAAASTVTLLAGGTETFAYLIINKSAGISVIQAAAPNATNITVNGSGGSYILQIISGDLDLNQQTFNFTSFFNSNQNDLGVDGTAGNLTRNILSSGGTGIFAVYNNTAVTHNITVTRLSANASLLVFGTGVKLTTGGIGAGGGGINFGNTISTVNGTLQLNSYGFVTGFAPTYGTGSFLIYNAGGSFNRNVEWGSLSGPGYPYHVTVQGNTSLILNTVTNGNADRAMAGNLLINALSSLDVGAAYAKKLTVAGNVQIDGTLTLPTLIGGDVYLAGNWLRTGIFTANDRAVFFYGAGNDTIRATGGQLFPYLYLTKNTLSNTVTLYDDISISKEFAVTSGTFELASKNATLKSTVTNTAGFGKVGAAGDVTYSGSGRFIVERFIPTGVIAGAHIKSWQFLAVPTNGGQTINAAWQEGNVLPSIGTFGLGTIITSQVAGAGFDIIGGAGPSMKTYLPATATWTGVANTTTVPLYNPKGYFIFVRGDRRVSAYNAAADSTTLRSTGKLFVPVSNPPATTTIATGKFESIGNPYASAIDFLNIGRPAAPAIDSVFYVWDPLLAGSYNLGGFQTISSVTGYKPTPGGTANYSNAVAYTKIQSGQAFFMHATGAGGTVSFTENAKLSGSNMVFRPSVNNTSINNRQYFKAALYTSTDVIADANVLAFDPAFDNSYESNDALKIMNAGENFAISSNAKILTIEARKPVVRTDTVRYVLNNLRIQPYQFRFTPENLNNAVPLAWLIDQYLHTKTRISLADSSVVNFSVTTDPASAAADRFMIIFLKKSTLPAGPVDISKKPVSRLLASEKNIPAISIYPNPVVNKNMQVKFENKTAGTYNLQLLNSMNQVIMEKSLAVKGNIFNGVIKLSTVAAGYYTLKMMAEDGTSTSLPVIVE